LTVSQTPKQNYSLTNTPSYSAQPLPTNFDLNTNTTTTTPIHSNTQTPTHSNQQTPIPSRSNTEFFDLPAAIKNENEVFAKLTGKEMK